MDNNLNKRPRKPKKPECNRTYEEVRIKDLISKDHFLFQCSIQISSILREALALNIDPNDLLISFSTDDLGVTEVTVVKVVTTPTSKEDMDNYEVKLAAYNKWMLDNKDRLEKEEQKRERQKKLNKEKEAILREARQLKANIKSLEGKLNKLKEQKLNISCKNSKTAPK